MDLPVPELCGQLLVGGFQGERLPEALRAALARGHRGGAILFKRNLPSLSVARELCAAIALASRPELPPFIGVDQEGGRVGRLPATLDAVRDALRIRVPADSLKD